MQFNAHMKQWKLHRIINKYEYGRSKRTRLAKDKRLGLEVMALELDRYKLMATMGMEELFLC